MNKKISSYNVYVEDSGRHLVFNTRTNALLDVPDQDYQSLKSLKHVSHTHLFLSIDSNP